MTGCTGRSGSSVLSGTFSFCFFCADSCMSTRLLLVLAHSRVVVLNNTGELSITQKKDDVSTLFSQEVRSALLRP